MFDILSAIKQRTKIKLYDRGNGLHGTTFSCMKEKNFCREYLGK
jgi:hypothetical protein